MLSELQCWSASSAVTNALYALLLLAAVGTLFANRKSADAANRLFVLQEREATLQEAQHRPNLQVYDAFSEGFKEGDRFSEHPLNVYLMNFGERPARILAATCRFLTAQVPVDIRTASCVRRQQIAHIVLFPGGGPIQDAISDYIERSKSILDWDKERVILTVDYCETDGTRTQRGSFDVPFEKVRRKTTDSEVTLRVLRDGEGESAGDRKG
jgi:hypothetical protein